MCMLVSSASAFASAFIPAPVSVSPCESVVCVAVC